MTVPTNFLPHPSDQRPDGSKSVVQTLYINFCCYPRRDCMLKIIFLKVDARETVELRMVDDTFIKEITLNMELIGELGFD